MWPATSGRHLSKYDKTAKIVASDGFDSNFSGAAFSLAQPIGGLVVATKYDDELKMPVSAHTQTICIRQEIGWRRAWVGKLMTSFPINTDTMKSIGVSRFLFTFAAIDFRCLSERTDFHHLTLKFGKTAPKCKNQHIALSLRDMKVELKLCDFRNETGNFNWRSSAT